MNASPIILDKAVQAADARARVMARLFGIDLWRANTSAHPPDRRATVGPGSLSCLIDSLARLLLVDCTQSRGCTVSSPQFPFLPSQAETSYLEVFPFPPWPQAAFRRQTPEGNGADLCYVLVLCAMFLESRIETDKRLLCLCAIIGLQQSAFDGDGVVPSK